MRNNKWKWLVLAIVLALVMGILTGCMPSDGTKLATIGDTTLTFGEGNFYARYYQSSYEVYSQYFGSDPNTMWKEYVDVDMTMEDSAKKTIQEALIKMVVLSQHAGEYGVEITEQDEALIEQAADQFISANDEKTLKVMSATKENVMSILRYILYNNRMNIALVADVDKNVPEEECERKVMSYVKVTYDPDKKDSKDIDTSDPDTIAEQIMTLDRDTALEEAEFLKDQTKGITDPDKFKEKIEELDFSAVTVNYGKDTDNPSAALCEKMWNVKKGAVCDPVEDEEQNAFYIALQTTDIDADATQSAKSSIISERETAAREEKTQELIDATSVSWNDSAWKKISFIKQGITLKTAEQEAAADASAGTYNTDPSLKAENGDTVNIDYSGSIDGVKFDGGTAAGQDLELGSGSFIDGFEEQVIGHSPGETFTIKVTFPDDYQKEDLAGQNAEFEITLNGIYE